MSRLSARDWPAATVLGGLVVGWHLASGGLLWRAGRVSRAWGAWGAERDIPTRALLGGWEPGAWARGDGLRALTRLLVHANLSHVLVNAVVLVLLALLLAPRLGHARVVGIALVGGVAGGLLSSGTGPLYSDGASACASALVGAALAHGFRDDGFSASARRLWLRGFVALACSDLLACAVLPRLDLSAHAGGLAAGLLLGLLRLSPKREASAWLALDAVGLMLMGVGLWQFTIPLHP